MSLLEKASSSWKTGISEIVFAYSDFKLYRGLNNMAKRHISMYDTRDVSDIIDELKKDINDGIDKKREDIKNRKSEVAMIIDYLTIRENRNTIKHIVSYLKSQDRVYLNMELEKIVL